VAREGGGSSVTRRLHNVSARSDGAGAAQAVTAAPLLIAAGAAADARAPLPGFNFATIAEESFAEWARRYPPPTPPPSWRAGHVFDEAAPANAPPAAWETAPLAAMNTAQLPAGATQSAAAHPSAPTAGPRTSLPATLPAAPPTASRPAPPAPTPTPGPAAAAAAAATAAAAAAKLDALFANRFVSAGTMDGATGGGSGSLAAGGGQGAAPPSLLRVGARAQRSEEPWVAPPLLLRRFGVTAGASGGAGS
jgi:hypothetical protein